MVGISGTAWREILRRVLAEGALIAAAILGAGYGGWTIAAVLAVLGLAIYVLVPRPQAPVGAFHSGRFAAVHMPDLMGAMLVTLFLALPFIIVAQDGWIGMPWGLMVLLWTPGLMAVAIFVIAIRQQCYWLLFEGDGIVLSTTRGTRRVGFAQIARIFREGRRLPAWVSGALMLFGGVRGAGVALLHGARQSTNLTLELRDGERIRLPMDAVEGGEKIVAGFSRAGLRVAEPADRRD